MKIFCYLLSCLVLNNFSYGSDETYGRFSTKRTYTSHPVFDFSKPILFKDALATLKTHPVVESITIKKLQSNAQLREFLPLCGSIKAIDLSFNSLDNEGCGILAQYLPNLQSLNLCFCNINTERANILAQASWDLTSLNLCSNLVGNEGGAALINAFPSLQTIDMQSTGIGAKTIESFKTPKYLNLLRNTLDDNTLKALENVSSIEELDLRQISMKPEQVETLCTSLKALKKLKLSYYKVGGVRIQNENGVIEFS